MVVRVHCHFFPFLWLQKSRGVGKCLNGAWIFFVRRKKLNWLWRIWLASVEFLIPHQLHVLFNHFLLPKKLLFPFLVRFKKVVLFENSSLLKILMADLMNVSASPSIRGFRFFFSVIIQTAEWFFSYAEQD